MNPKQAIKRNKLEIVTGASIVGFGASLYLTGLAAYKAGRFVEADDSLRELDGKKLDDFKVLFANTWKFYIPAVVSGGLTATGLVYSSRQTKNKVSAATQAYLASENMLKRYRDSVVEELGENKDVKFFDKGVERELKENPPPSNLYLVDTTEVLCCELYTKRYFKSTKENLSRAQNEINAQILTDYYVTMDDFYDLIGLEHTTNSNNLGWDSDKLLDLIFSSVLLDDGRVALAFEYNYVKVL